jgi:hypothetical protein
LGDASGNDDVSRSGIFFILTVSLTAAGCATRPSLRSEYVPLTPAARAAITSTRVVVGIDAEREQSKWVEQYGGTNQAGLLGVILSTAILHNIESSKLEHQRTTVSIRNAAVKFNFASRYRGALEQALRSLPWLHLRSVSREPVLQRDKYKALLEHMPDDTLLICDVAYDLTPDSAALTVTSSVTLYVNSPRPAASSAGGGDGTEEYPVLYNNRITFEYVDTDAKPAAADWSDNDGAKLTRALQTGIDAIVRMIALDLQANGPPPASPTPILTRGRCTGRALRGTDGQTMLRGMNGELCISTSRSDN